MEQGQVNKPTLRPNKLCDSCRYNLIHGARYKKSDSWMVLEITSLITLINVALKDNKYLIKYGNDVEGINKIFCLGCFLPDTLKKIIHTAKTTRDMEAIKAIGEN